MPRGREDCLSIGATFAEIGIKSHMCAYAAILQPLLALDKHHNIIGNIVGSMLSVPLLMVVITRGSALLV